MNRHPEAVLCSDPLLAGLQICDDAGCGQPLSDERRRRLRRELQTGQLERLRLQAITFRASYPNGNCLRFRAADLADLAASFAGVPFLRDHNTRQVEARAGSVLACELLAEADGTPALLHTLELTVPRDIEAFLNGQMDRFSIAWTWDAITCSICQADWLEAGCPHWPGRRYRQRQPDGRDETVLCELIFERPRGREVSAVNAPAVPGTGVRSVLASLRGGWPAPSRLLRGEEWQMTEDNLGVVAQPLALPKSVGPSAGHVQVVALQTGALDEAAAGAVQTGAQAGAQPGTRPGALPGTQVGALRGALPSAPDGLTGGAAGLPAGELTAELLAAQRTALLEARLATCGLPREMQELVRQGLAADWRPSQLDESIQRTRAAWAGLEEARTVRGMAPRDGRISGMLTGLDQVELALAGLLAGRRPERGVRPLSGIREFYVLTSGDYEMHGVFRPDNVGLAAVDSSTMAGMVADALNKVVVNHFQAYPRWWEPIVTVEDFATLQQAHWVTLGGVGELPTVAEGSAYQEMSWAAHTETADWVKKGGYLGITLEAMDRDDTRRLQQAGPALARAAYITLGKAVAGIFSANAGIGPTMSDGQALFHANHNNLGSSALSYSAWDATRVAMRKQTELNSGERLGGLVVPRYLLVPPDLEGSAVQVLASELQPGQSNLSANVYSEGNTHEARLAAAHQRVVVVDFFSDSNNWAVCADPQLYPSIGLGFRFGREPEIFSVASPTTGLLFANDTLPVKVRFFFAVGPTDWRGLYKHNVTGG